MAIQIDKVNVELFDPSVDIYWTNIFYGKSMTSILRAYLLVPGLRMQTCSKPTREGNRMQIYYENLRI